MLSGITITCFAASYGVSLVLEVSRLFFRTAVRVPVIYAFAGAGLFAHTSYLITRTRSEIAAGRGIPPLSSWYDFCLLAAWMLVVAYLIIGIRRPQNAVGIFFLPLILALIGVAVPLYETASFRTQTALGFWRSVHGFALATGTATVTLGFATGLMYLAQSYRLKHKLPPRPGFRLPTLEWLQRFNRESLIFSTCLLALGLLSGVILNSTHRTGQGRAIQWTDPVVLSSGVLFAWLILATVFEFFYRPARQGQKVAYLTLANFVFLCLALYFVLFGEHAVQ